MDKLPRRPTQKWAESRIHITNSGHNPTWPECHVARLPSELIPSRQPPRWTDSQVDRTKSEHNPELKEPIVDTILLGKNVMWPDFKVYKIEKDKHQVGPTQKGRELKVSLMRFERPYRRQRTLWTDCHVGRLQVVKHPGEQNAKCTWSQIEIFLHEHNPK